MRKIIRLYQCSFCHAAWRTGDGLRQHERSGVHTESLTNPSLQRLSAIRLWLEIPAGFRRPA